MLPIVSDVADLVLGRRCLGCMRPGPGVCETCLRQLRRSPHRVTRAGLDAPVLAVADYSGLTQQLLISYKEHGYRSLAAGLGWILADAIWATRSLFPDPSIDIVRVPSHRRSRRGYDALGDISSVAMRAVGSAGIAPHDRRLLHTNSDYPALKHLGRSARRQHVAGAFRAAASSTPTGPILLVDDIITTGATATEAISVLSHAGFTVAAVAVIAATS